MGNTDSLLTSEKLEELQQTTHYNARELEELLNRYRSYDDSDGGANGIQLEDFLCIPDFCGCPVLSTVAAAHANKDTGSIHPQAFITMLSAFSSKASTEEKYRLLFDSVDIYKEGCIGFDELFSFYKSLMSPALPDSYITTVTVHTLQSNSLQQTGKITYDEFKQFVSLSELREKMTFDLQILS